MDLYHLGPVGWVESQAVYHALASLDREGLVICYPTTPYICLGLHDDLDYEIDRAYCRERRIPLLRRETGGGVVYLDDRQLFFQLVLRHDNPLLPLPPASFLRKVPAGRHFRVSKPWNRRGIEAARGYHSRGKEIFGKRIGGHRGLHGICGKHPDGLRFRNDEPGFEGP